MPCQDIGPASLTIRRHVLLAHTRNAPFLPAFTFASPRATTVLPLHLADRDAVLSTRLSRHRSRPFHVPPIPLQMLEVILLDFDDVVPLT